MELSKELHGSIMDNAAMVRRPFILTTPQEPPDVYYMMEPFISDGTCSNKVSRVVAEARPRAYSASTLTGLCAMVSALTEVGGTFEGQARKRFAPASVAIFVGRESVAAVFDEVERRHTAVFVPRISEGLRRIMAEPPEDPTEENGSFVGLSQRELVWALRTEFAGGNVDPPSFLPIVRQLKFSSSSEGSSVLSVGRESLGKQVTAAALGMESGQQIPESVRLGGQVFENLLEEVGHAAFDIRCAVDVDLEHARFTIRPEAGAVERVLQAAEAGMASYIRAHVPEGVVVLDQSAANLGRK